MSYVKARERIESRQDQPKADAPDPSLLCRMPGCGRRWTVNIGNGRLCSDHEAALTKSRAAAPPKALAAIPKAKFQPHWQDDTGDDE